MLASATAIQHHYIDRGTGQVRSELMYADRLLRFLYAAPWEERAWLMRALTSARASQVLGFLHYDCPWGASLWGIQRFVRALGVDLGECVDAPHRLASPRQVFERKIRYWDRRPMETTEAAIVSPADARVLVGSFSSSSSLQLKGKFFDFSELFGADRSDWLEAFAEGDYAVFRLTPDKYHYNHVPATGTVADHYHLHGRYHSCNPGSVVSVVTPYSKNARTVTIIDTDVPGGARIGLVAMVEVVALMIGAIEQCYSSLEYRDPRPMEKWMLLRKGQPKSLYRPGSSTTVLVFQRGRVHFSRDLIANMMRVDVPSRFSHGFGRPLVETDLSVRSTIAYRDSGEQTGEG